MVLEVPSPVAGVLQETKVDEGAVVTADELLAIVEAGATAAGPSTEPPTSPEKPAEPRADTTAGASQAVEDGAEISDQVLTPAVRRLVKELNIDAGKIQGTGKNGRILKSDVMAYLDQQTSHRRCRPARVPRPAQPATRVRKSACR